LVREDGQYKKAVLALSSHGNVPDNSDTVEALQALDLKGTPIGKHELSGAKPFSVIKTFLSDSSDVIKTI
jgi:hypothetical protein